MPKFPSKAARRVLLVAVAVVASAVPCASALAATTLTITLPDEEKRTVDLATIGKPDTDTIYNVRYEEDGVPRKVPVVGYSLMQVFAAAGASAGFEEVKLGADLEIALSGNQLNDVPPPALRIVGDDIQFVRNSFGPKDVNGHQLKTFSDGSLNLVQKSESSFNLQALAKRKGEVGKPHVFQARWGGGGAGKQYRFKWDFGDGGTAGKQDVEHEFAEAGSYDAVVTATTRDSDGKIVEEDSAKVTVKIGEPKQERDDREGGGTNDADGAPYSGTYSGSSGAGSSSGDTTTPYTPSTPSTDGFDSILNDKDPPASSFGDQVEGALLANVSAPLNDSTASAARAARTGNPDFEVPESDDKVPPAALAGLGALALMGAGAGLESGRRPRLRRPRLQLSLPRR